MSSECCTPENDVMLLTCAGASNTGQLANRTAVELTQEGLGKYFCLAGIGARLSGFVQSAKDVPHMIVIDGCPVGCAKGTLAQAGIPLKNYVVVTELGIGKNKNFNLKPEEIVRVKQAVKEEILKVVPGKS